MGNFGVCTGIDNLIMVREELEGLRVGLITGPSGVTRTLAPSADRIADCFSLCALFGPEHGIHGNYQAGAKVPEREFDEKYNVPVYSLYGAVTAPTPQMLSGLDALLFDMQDVGSRYYTYLYTMTRSMQSCAQAGIPMYVFDRPNPIGLDRIEGNILSPAFSSFVGEFAVPIRYGLTIGEFAAYINLTERIGCRLTVVPCDGLTRDMYWSDTGLPFVPPSPNIPTEEAALHYVGTCLFEGTNLSEGRGTTKPFSLIGAPWLRSDELMRRMEEYGFEGVRFRRAFFTPTFSKYAGECCEGLELYITDRKKYQPFDVALRLLDEIRQCFLDFSWNPHHIDRLFGDDKLRTEYIGRTKIDEFLRVNNARLAHFRDRIRPYFIY